MKICAYLTFNGNCREAMRFYQKCFGGKLHFQTLGDSPLHDKMPKKMRDCILHATLSNEVLLLMGSDLIPESGLIKGNSVSLSLDCSSEKEVEILYEKLSLGGKRNHPLDVTFWGALFGDLTDRFGNHWLLNYSKISKQ